MFFRSKQTHAGRALQLIESFRDGDGLPRQRIVVSLGGVDVPQDLWKAVASLVETLLRGETLLVPFPQPVQKWASLVLQKIEKKGWKSKSAIKRLAEEKSSEKIDETLVSHHNTVELGPELVAERAWNELNLQQCLVSLRLSSRQILAAKISICNRLIEPCSEHSLTEWLRGTAFSDLLGEDVTRLNDDSFYRISDTLLEHKDSIEKFLVRRETSLFSLRRTVLLYDLSNTYFEGLCQKNPKAARTKASKHQRSDVPSVAFGMVLDGDGFLLRHKMFEGNIGEASTLMEMIQGLSAETDQKPVVIIDGGIASEKNLHALAEAGYDYIAVGKRPTRLAYAQEFATLPFSEISNRTGKDPVQIAVKDGEGERTVFCYSEKRGDKERAILSCSEKRLLSDLEKLRKRLENNRLQKPGALEKAIGRLQERHPRAARYYDIGVEKEATSTLRWSRKDEAFENALSVTGCYYLRCSRKDISPEEIWKIYMTLTRVEAGFRALKSVLGLRPIFHQREDRCEGHIFITVLAYHLLHWVEYMLQSSGDRRSWPTIRRLLQTHSYTTIVYPAPRATRSIRAPGVPDEAQQQIYATLGINWRSCAKTVTVA